MTTDLKHMTQTDFDALMAEIKMENPNLFQFIADFLNKKVSIQEVEAFQKMDYQVQQLYIKNYKARS